MSWNLRTPAMLVLLLGGLATFTGCQKESTPEPSHQSATVKEVTVEITGMT